MMSCSVPLSDEGFKFRMETPYNTFLNSQWENIKRWKVIYDAFHLVKKLFNELLNIYITTAWKNSSVCSSTWLQLVTDGCWFFLDVCLFLKLKRREPFRGTHFNLRPGGGREFTIRTLEGFGI